MSNLDYIKQLLIDNGYSFRYNEYRKSTKMVTLNNLGNTILVHYRVGTNYKRLVFHNYVTQHYIKQQLERVL